MNMVFSLFCCPSPLSILRSKRTFRSWCHPTWLDVRDNQRQCPSRPSMHGDRRGYRDLSLSFHSDAEYRYKTHIKASRCLEHQQSCPFSLKLLFPFPSPLPLSVLHNGVRDGGIDLAGQSQHGMEEKHVRSSTQSRISRSLSLYKDPHNRREKKEHFRLFKQWTVLSRNKQIPSENLKKKKVGWCTWKENSMMI